MAFIHPFRVAFLYVREVFGIASMVGVCRDDTDDNRVHLVVVPSFRPSVRKRSIDGRRDAKTVADCPIAQKERLTMNAV